MESSVDLPQPDGPEIETYSPRSIRRSIPASACVSTSSVRKTFVNPSSSITALSISTPVWLIEFHSFKCVPCRHVGQDHSIPNLKAFDDFDRIHGAAPQLHLNAHRLSSWQHFEHSNRAVRLTISRPADV